MPGSVCYTLLPLPSRAPVTLLHVPLALQTPFNRYISGSWAKVRVNILCWCFQHFRQLSMHLHDFLLTYYGKLSSSIWWPFPIPINVNYYFNFCTWIMEETESVESIETLLLESTNLGSAQTSYKVCKSLTGSQFHRKPNKIGLFCIHYSRITPYIDCLLSS